MSERVIRVQPSELISAANNITTYRGNYIDAYDDIMTKAQNLTVEPMPKLLQEKLILLKVHLYKWSLSCRST